jgi:Tol biopolymer transport system component
VIAEESGQGNEPDVEPQRLKLQPGNEVRVRSLLGIGSACAALVLTVCADARASPPFEGPWLAFPAMNALKPWGFSIRGVNADGSGRVLLVRGSQRDIVPNLFSTVSWSADGAWLAFAGSKGRRKGIYERLLGEPGARFLRGTVGGRNPIFSPDGRRLAFARDDLHGRVTTTWVADADGREAFRLTPQRGDVEYLPSSFSPDGSALAVTRRNLRSNTSSVLLFRLGGHRGVQVLAGHASEAAFSPDGSQIALVRQTMSRRKKVRMVVNKDLYVMSVDGTSSEAVTHTPPSSGDASELGPIWAAARL